MTDLSVAAEAIDEFARLIERIRFPAGTYVNGVWSEAAGTTETIAATHQPASARDLRDLPEGQRVDAMRAIWSRSELLGADETTGRKADVLVIEGEQWEVIASWHRSEAGFWKAVAGLKNDRQRGQ